MSDDQLAKLAVAREKALAVRRAQKVEKLKAEAARLEAPSEESQSSVEHVATVEDPPSRPSATVAKTIAPQPREVDPAPKPKGKKKEPKQADPVVVVEQSSGDEDTFEAPPGGSQTQHFAVQMNVVHRKGGSARAIVGDVRCARTVQRNTCNRPKHGRIGLGHRHRHRFCG